MSTTMPFTQGPAPDPNTTTREDFTAYHVRQQCPPNADPRFKKLFQDLQKMLDLLAHHEAMRPNLQQTYMTKAAKRTKVYFMWDFIGRSLGYLYNVNPVQPLTNQPLWDEVFGRTMYGVQLIQDDTGKLDSMSASPGYVAGAEFGDEILTLADEMQWDKYPAPA